MPSSLKLTQKYRKLTKSKCPTNSDVSFFLVNYWIFSLCGEKPLHWVLGWVDFTGKEYTIFDGLPKLYLSTWAFSEWKAVYQSHLTHHNMTFQLLIKTVNYVHMYLKRDEIQSKKDPSWNIYWFLSLVTVSLFIVVLQIQMYVRKFYSNNLWTQISPMTMPCQMLRMKHPISPIGINPGPLSSIHMQSQRICCITLAGKHLSWATHITRNWTPWLLSIGMNLPNVLLLLNCPK